VVITALLRAGPELVNTYCPEKRFIPFY